MSSEMRELVRKAEALAACVMAVDSYSRDELRVFAENFRDEARALLARTEAGADYPECSGDPKDCPENEGHGCCKTCTCPSGDGSLRWPCPTHKHGSEAGEDGADTFAEWLATEMPAGTVIGNPAWWANRIARQYRVRSGISRPQDASGDAEDARRYRWARDHVGGTAWNDDNFATVTIGVTVPKPRGTCAFDVTAEMLDAAIDAAMRAKEAK